MALDGSLTERWSDAVILELEFVVIVLTHKSSNLAPFEVVRVRTAHYANIILSLSLTQLSSLLIGAASSKQRLEPLPSLFCQRKSASSGARSSVV